MCVGTTYLEEFYTEAVKMALVRGSPSYKSDPDD